MSRLLDMLRPQRRDGARIADGHPLVVPRPEEPGTAVHRAVVLDTLSGATPPGPWWRRRLLAALAVIGACSLGLYLAVAVVAGLVVGPPRAEQDPPERAAPARSTDAGTAAVIQPTAPLPVQPGPAVVVAADPPAGARTKPPATARAKMAPVAPASAAAMFETKPAVTTGPALRTGDRDHADPHLARALRYQQAGEVDSAIVEYRALLEANEANAQAHNNLGLLYQTKGLVEQATGEFRRAVVIDPAYDKARNNLGVAMMRAGNVEAAIDQFRRILAAHADNLEATINLGLAQRAGGQAEQARETLIRAIEIDDRSAAAHYNLALLYEDAHEVVRALDHYEAYLRYATGAEAKDVAAVRDHCQALRQGLARR